MANYKMIYDVDINRNEKEYRLDDVDFHWFANWSNLIANVCFM